jgi:hypothetical protein
MTRRAKKAAKRARQRSAKYEMAAVVEVENGDNRHGRWRQFHINRFFSLKVFGEQIKKSCFVR